MEGRATTVSLPPEHTPLTPWTGLLTRSVLLATFSLFVYQVGLVMLSPVGRLNLFQNEVKLKVVGLYYWTCLAI